MPVLSLACHLPHNTPNIPSRYNNEQTTKQTKAINNSYIYISHVNVTQTVPDISPLMPMHQDPLLVKPVTQSVSRWSISRLWFHWMVFCWQIPVCLNMINSSMSRMAFRFNARDMKLLITLCHSCQHGVVQDSRWHGARSISSRWDNGRR